MSDLKERLLAAIAAEPSPTRAIAARRSAGMLAGATLASIAIWIVAGGIRPTGRPLALIAATSLGAVAIAAGAVALAVRRGRSMLGRPAPLLLAVVLATPLALLAWKAEISSSFTGMTVPWPDRVGLRCLGVALASGIAPLAAFLRLWRGTQPAHPRLTGLALGTAAGAISWVPVDLWCPVAHLDHLLLGHVLPIALFATLGAVAGRLLEASSR